jgi:hypothetical protein
MRKILTNLLSNIMRRTLVGAAFLVFASPQAYAACSGPPSGNEGDIIYNSSYHLMQYCNGTAWINMGASANFGTLTTGALCTATSSTQISCTTSPLGVALGGTGTSTAFTQGSIPFASASGVYSQDNAKFFWDDTNYRLGIGTAAPGAGLTVNGTAAFMLGTDYTTTGAQQDVAINTASAIRYNGSNTATFYGIVAGSNGQILNLHNASAYTLTLANQSASETTAANKIITGTGADLAMASNSSVILQYDTTASRWRVIGGSGSGGTLAGLSDVTLTSPASGNLLSYNGSKWVNSTVASAVTAAIAPSFMAKQPSTQSIPATIFTKLTFGAAQFDTNNNWSSSNNRYTPTVAGKYFLEATAGFDGLGSSADAFVVIYKNGSAYAWGTRINVSASGVASNYSTASAIADANGTTDYFEAYVYVNPAASTINDPNRVHFSGGLLAPLASGSVAGTGTANYIPMWSNSTNLTNSALYQNSGNIGIGTTSPAPDVKADINGAAKIAGTGSETCASAADIGKFRYNASKGYFEICSP